MRKNLLIALSLFISAIGHAYGFEIYAFVPYKVEGGHYGKASIKESREFFERIGIKHIKVVYENELFEKKPKSNHIALASSKMTEAVAEDADSSGKIPVSLDVESWNRFDKTTPEKYLDLLNNFNKKNQGAFVGLYSTVPQNIYKWDEKNIKRYEELNARYSVLVPHIDYLSPSFYNYNGHKYSEWLPSVKYNLQTALDMGKGKPVIPFITPEVRMYKRYYEWLSYDEMWKRLDFLKQSGASGVIIWTSSNAKDKNGDRPTLNMNEGWVRALVDFQQKNRK